MENRLRFHYLALDRGVWLCPGEDCTFPLGHEELESFVVNVASKSSGGSLSSLATPDADVSLELRFKVRHRFYICTIIICLFQ